MGQCECGGTWLLKAEDVMPLDGRWFDSLVARCYRCGNERGFLFDVTAFFQVHPRVWAAYGTGG